MGGALVMNMRPVSLSTAVDSANCGPRGGDKAWTKKFTCLGVYVFFPGLKSETIFGRMPEPFFDMKLVFCWSIPNRYRGTLVQSKN